MGCVSTEYETKGYTILRRLVAPEIVDFVSLYLAMRSRVGALTADGQGPVSLQAGDRVIIGQHEHRCLFARVGSSSYFYHRLMERFGYWHPQAASG